MKRRLRLPTLTAEFFNLPVIVGVAMQVLPSRQTVFSHRLTYAACLVLALHMGVTLPATAVAAAGKGGGGAGGLGQNFWSPNLGTQGGSGGGLEPITPDGKAGAGGNAAHSPGTGGAAPKAASSNDAVTTNVSGSRGTCAAPCDDNHGGGGGGVAILGGENINLVIATNVSVTGGNGAAGSPGGADALQNMAYVGGGGGGGAGIAAVSGVLTLNGPVSGGIGGASRGHPGAGGDAVVLTRGDIIINALVSGGQGGTRDLNLAPRTFSGDGGVGISIGSGTVVNNNAVLGGFPGTVQYPNKGSVGKRGTALRAGSDTTVTNKGSFNSNGATAVLFEGDNNTFIMWSGSDIIGDLYFKGKDNQLAFGSDDGAPITQYIWGDGDLDFGTAGTYTVRVTPTAADRLDVAKTARLTGAVLRVNAMASDLYAETQRYTILHAGEKFNGTRFAGVTSNLAYLTPTLSYSDDDQDAFLTLVRKAAPAPVPVPPVIEPVPPATNPAPPVTDPVPPTTEPTPPVTDPAPPTTEPVPPASDPASPPATDAATPGDDGAAPSSPIRFADLLGNRNTIATANAIESLPADHELYRRALSLPEGAPQAYFSALAGEIHASVRHALPGLDTTIRDVPLKHLRANLNAGRHAGSPTAAAGVSDAPPAASTLPGSDAHPAWAQLVGSWQDQGATDDSNAVRLRTGGIFIGVDHAIGAGWRLGGALGYTDSQLRTDGANAKSNISSYSAIAYGGKAFETRGGRLNVLLGTAYTWHNVGTRRGVVAGALDQTLRADYRASATQLFAELGYALAASGALAVEPYAGLAWASQRSSAFQERGGSGALSGVGQSARTTTTTLGARLRHALQSGRFDGALTVGAGWRRAFGDLSTTSTQSFDAGDAFTIVGAPIARDTLLLETGLQARTGRNAMAGFHYAGQFSSRNRNHGATLTWRWAF